MHLRKEESNNRLVVAVAGAVAAVGDFITVIAWPNINNDRRERLRRRLCLFTSSLPDTR